MFNHGRVGCSLWAVNRTILSEHEGFWTTSIPCLLWVGASKLHKVSAENKSQSDQDKMSCVIPTLVKCVHQHRAWSDNAKEKLYKVMIKLWEWKFDQPKEKEKDKQKKRQMKQSRGILFLPSAHICSPVHLVGLERFHKSLHKPNPYFHPPTGAPSTFQVFTEIAVMHYFLKEQTICFSLIFHALIWHQVRVLFLPDEADSVIINVQGRPSTWLLEMQIFFFFQCSASEIIKYHQEAISNHETLHRHAALIIYIR